MFLNNFHSILSNYTLVLQYQDLLCHHIFISLMHLINGAQVLNIIPFILSSTRLALASSPASVIVIICYYSFNKCVCISIITDTWF